MTMQIAEEQLQEITEVIEDTVQYACEKHFLSGELLWTVVNALTEVKLAEFRGEVLPDPVED